MIFSGYCEYTTSRSLTFSLEFCLILTFITSCRTHSYAGLVSFWIGRETNDRELLRKGTECKDKIEKLVVSASTWNFQNSECRNLHFVVFLYALHILHDMSHSVFFILTAVFAEAYLLQAEAQFCERNFDVAETLYDAAIFSSKTHKFLNEEALANELAGHFYLETGRKNESVPYFIQAFEKYNEWGAVAKAASLYKYF